MPTRSRRTRAWPAIAAVSLPPPPTCQDPGNGCGARRALAATPLPDPPPQGGGSAPSKRPAQAKPIRSFAVVRLPRNGPSGCARFRSTARATRPCARLTGSRPGGARDRPRHRGDRRRDQFHRPDAGRAVRHLARARTERSLLRPARPPQERRWRQRRLVRRRTGARPDRRARRARHPAAAAGEPGVLKVGHNIKFDLQMLSLRGIETKSYDDMMLMSYVLDAGRSNHGLDALASRYFGHVTIEHGRADRLGQVPHHVRLRRRSARPPNTPPSTPT